MTDTEVIDMYKSAVKSASDHGATMVLAVLKQAQDTTATPSDKPPTFSDRLGQWDTQLTNWGNKTIGAGAGNYVSTGAGMAGLGALYGLLFGDKKKGTLDAILNNALLFGGLGLGGQYLKNNI